MARKPPDNEAVEKILRAFDRVDAELTENEKNSRHRRCMEATDAIAALGEKRSSHPETPRSRAATCAG
ncbi:MAG: hypothetical protein ACRD04_00460 [Terriglobales bacterium]